MGHPRTDYPERKTFQKRYLASKRRGDVLVKITRPAILVSFKRNFDAFCAEVAYHLREYIKYRSDGGRFARGLVRVSGDLGEIHKGYLSDPALTPPENGKIRLIAALYRRKETVPDERWVMSIKFVAPDWIDGEGFELEADPEVQREIYRKGLSLFIGIALAIAAGIEGERGKRIEKFLTLGHRLGHRRAVDLWYYDDWMITQWIMASEEERMEMLRAAGGFPPAGWRRYPFRAWEKYTQNIEWWTEERIRKSIYAADEDIYKSIYAFRRATASGSDAETGWFYKFRDHMRELQNDPTSLYSVYK